MTTPDLADVLALIAHRDGHHLSTYLPAAPEDGESLAYRLSKRFQRGPNEWSGWYDVETAGLALARHARSLCQPEGLPTRGGTGVFLANGFARVVALPAGAPDRVVGGSCFFVKPVLAAVQAGHEFHLLSLSHRRTQLFRGSADRLTPVALAGIPSRIDDPTLAHKHGKRHTLHTVSRPHGRRMAAVFNGHASQSSDETHDLERYYRRVEQAVTAALRPGRGPLVLAGVEEEQALYRRLNSYPHLLDDGIGGHPDRRSAAELHGEAWPLAKAACRRPADAALRQFDQFRGTGRTAERIREVVLAAADGDLATLMVSPDRNVWGTFDPGRREVEVHPTREPGDEELTNLAAVLALRHGGVVHAVGAAELGDREALAVRWLPMDNPGKGGAS